MDLSNEININCFANLNQAQKDKQLFEAAKDNNTQLIIDLLTAGAEPYFSGEDNNTALHWSAYHGNDKTVQLLLDKKANINSKGLDGYSPLHFAAQEGYVSTVRLLCEQGANVLALDDSKDAPIHIASFHGRDELVGMLLLRYKVDINLKGKHGWTSLHIASKEGRVSTAKLLCEQGANVLALDDDKDAPIHMASLYGQHEIVKLFLLQYKVDVNLEGEKSWTPLHCAIRGECVSTIRLLCEQGANVFAKNEKFQNPFVLALDSTSDLVFFFLFIFPKEKIGQLMLVRPRDDYDKLEKFKTAISICRKELKSIVFVCKNKENNILVNQPLELFYNQLHSLVFPVWYSEYFLLKDLNNLIKKYYSLKEELMLCEAEYDHKEEEMVESPSCGKMICETLLNAASFVCSYLPSFSNPLKRKREEDDSNAANINNTKRQKPN